MADTKGFTWGLGRRKSATARVRIRSGNGTVTVNDRPGEQYFTSHAERKFLRQPFEVTELTGKFDVFVNVSGGGNIAQAEAVRLGISRCLIQVNKELEPKLKEHNFLTRDSRMKERKKYGLRGARRGTQFSKR